MEKISLPQADGLGAFLEQHKDKVFYVASPDENIIVSNNGEWIPKETFDKKLKKKSDEIEALEGLMDSNKSELEALRVKLKDSSEVEETIQKLETEKQGMQQKLANTNKIFALKEAYGLLGIKRNYLDFVVSKEHPDLSKVELNEKGEFNIPEDHSKTLKESYKEIIGEFKLKGIKPNAGDDTDDFSKYKNYTLTQKVQLKKENPELYSRVFPES